MSPQGSSLSEALVVLLLSMLALLAASTAAGALRADGRMAAAAREMASVFAGLRWLSVASGRGHGLWFRRGPRGWQWFEVRDDNGNGLRVAELLAGTDRVLSGPHRLEQRVAGVGPGFPTAGPFPRLPPEPGWLGDLHDPIKFGRGDVISFTPLGTSSSGSLYLTDGRDGLWAVVVHGPAARIRVRRFDPRTRTWLD